ncbi:Pr6Pr family membrane protein [Pseudomonas auratipiscis]|uniref:Pr6Pr family membrane protein n=1 Tax=Pseudomonas auratipiscis TaxID=3115853 RepID=A0AB35WYT2_9PSED|nr:MULTISPECIES: Pr6Pr family membrane protein [unclassified Pseudomonas]MEE1868266.1 Pr6Pr family membrane protein [Pseudomonas sp. 120P]MEE1957215.1 Pr6Pr family membrane protein [Pseudomonas sp. 119P]
MIWREVFVGLAAILGWSALAIQLYLVLLARWDEQASLIGGLITYFSYFTVLSNTLVAVVLSHAAFGKPGRARDFFLAPAVSSGVTASIVLVGLAYSLLLRHLWHPQGWQWLADELLHDVMPVVFVIYWWCCVEKGSLRLKHLGAWLLYPVGYFAYALLRGQSIGAYPYPFFDVVKLGYGQVLLNALAILVGFIVIGLLVIGLDRWQGGRLAKARTQP